MTTIRKHSRAASIGAFVAVALLTGGIASSAPSPTDPCYKVENSGFCCQTGASTSSIQCSDSTGGVVSTQVGDQIWTCRANATPNGLSTSTTCNNQGQIVHCEITLYGCVPSGGVTTYQRTGTIITNCYSADLGMLACPPLGP